MKIRSDIGLSFDDVLLVPKLGVVEHRKDVDLTTRLNPWTIMSLPFISAPMASVTESQMAKQMAWLGGAGIIHRFQSIDEQRADWEHAVSQFHDSSYNQRHHVGCSVGLDDWTRVDALWYAGVRFFCVDVAHGHSERVVKFVAALKAALEDWVEIDGFFSIMAGNVATAAGAYDLIQAGADTIKVGIGPGAVCTTRSVTGFGVPQLTAISEVAYVADELEATVVADGGIRSSGDIAKALAVGADSVMLGRLLAGADESPHPGLYWGAASHRQNGHRAPEGVEAVVERTGPVEDTIKQLAWGLRSAVSYGGAANLEDFQNKAEFVRVAPGVVQESGVRV